MNWFTKISSVYFTVQNSFKISQPKTVSQIGDEMWNWAETNVSHKFKPDTPEWIAVDGLNVDETVGVVNWYVPNGVDGNDVLPYIKFCISELLNPLGIFVGSIVPDRSKMFDINVFRVYITKNETTKSTKLPVVNIKQKSVMPILRILGLSPDADGSFVGSIDAQDFKNRIQQAKQNMPSWDLSSPRSVTDDVVDEIQGAGYHTFQPPPLTTEDAVWYLSRLEELADFVIRSCVDYLGKYKQQAPQSARTIVWS